MTRRAMNGVAPVKSARSKVMVSDGSSRRRRRSQPAAVPSSVLPLHAAPVAASVNLSDDEDDDVRITSPRRFEQAKSAASVTRQRSSRVGGTLEVVVSLPDNRIAHEAMTELRLGPSSFNAQGTPMAPLAGPSLRPSDREQMIDLTRPSADAEDCIFVNEFQQKKRKLEPPKELKLTCAICMDAMHEETSTICGHLFCRRCVLHAISTSKKCPTCRKTLTSSQTHRIYLSGSLRG